MWLPSIPNSLSNDRMPRPAITRRTSIARAMLGITGLPLLARVAYSSESLGVGDDAAEIAEVHALAKRTGLAPFVDTRSENFLGLGNASLVYCKNAVTICEALARDFLAYFRDRGFKVALPPHRMTVITLKDAVSYQSLLRDDPGAPAGGAGHYDLKTNRLVVFDSRDTSEDAPGNPERINLFTLIHETLHLLSFNTGLLARQMDVPACISEGLATYGELWRSKGRVKIGTVNLPRLETLTDPRAGDDKWIPIPDLLTKDEFFDKEETALLAYAEAWLLVHCLLQRDAQHLPRFRAYLAKIPVGESSAPKRLKVAEAELGSLKALDREVNRRAKEQLRKVK
jgi:hypothetical protein